MPHYVGLDVSKWTTSICVIDQDGVIVKEGVVESDPKAIIGFLRGESMNIYAGAERIRS